LHLLAFIFPNRNFSGLRPVETKNSDPSLLAYAMSPAALCLSISRRTGSSFSGMGQHISHVLNFEKELLRRAHLQPADGNTDGGTGGLTPRSGAGLFHLT
jgi:hypothetical protein